VGPIPPLLRQCIFRQGHGPTSVYERADEEDVAHATRMLYGLARIGEVRTRPSLCLPPLRK